MVTCYRRDCRACLESPPTTLRDAFVATGVALAVSAVVCAPICTLLWLVV